MKKVLLTIIILYSTMLLHAQIELKGIELGKKYFGEEIIETTLGGIHGALIISKIKSNHIWKITFVPADENGQKTMLIEPKLNTLKNGMENKYGIIFQKNIEKDYPNNYTFNAFKGDVGYFIVVTQVQSSNYDLFDIVLAVTNINMVEIAEKEDREKTNADF